MAVCSFLDPLNMTPIYLKSWRIRLTILCGKMNWLIYMKLDYFNYDNFAFQCFKGTCYHMEKSAYQFIPSV